MCCTAVDRRRCDEWTFVCGQHEAAGHQLAAFNAQASHLHAADAARSAGLEHTARRPTTGLRHDHHHHHHHQFILETQNKTMSENTEKQYVNNKFFRFMFLMYSFLAFYVYCLCVLCVFYGPSA